MISQKIGSEKSSKENSAHKERTPYTPTYGRVSSLAWIIQKVSYFTPFLIKMMIWMHDLI